MNNNVDIDEYIKYLPIVGTPEIESENLPAAFIQRLQRIRGLYDHWLQFPNKPLGDLVDFDIDMLGVKKTQAYNDVHLVQILIGINQKTTKDFMRWRIDNMIDENIRAARREKDFRAVAALLKVKVKNAQTDREDPPEAKYEDLARQEFEMSDDIRIVDPTKKKIPQSKIQELIRKYGGKDLNIEDADFEELENNDDDNNDE